MTKIPVKIIEFSDGGKKIQEVMIDLVDSMQIDGDPGKKIESSEINILIWSSKQKNYFMEIK